MPISAHTAMEVSIPVDSTGVLHAPSPNSDIHALHPLPGVSWQVHSVHPRVSSAPV